MTKKKKIIILSVMIGLLILTGYINVALNNSLSGTTNPSTTTQASTVNQNFPNNLVPLGQGLHPRVTGPTISGGRWYWADRSETKTTLNSGSRSPPTCG